MGKPFMSRLKGILPSIILFVIVLVYLTGYITFRATLPHPSPSIALPSDLVQLQKSHFKFLNDWSSENEARYNWQSLLLPCERETVWQKTKEWWKKKNRTDPLKSFVSLWEIHPAGQFSRFFIQSQNSQGELKGRGGDGWRAHICGPACLNPSIRDFGNGTYEIKFLALESGKYRAKIYLDYTLCDGLKDPPEDWFIKGNAQGKDQIHGILGNDIPYVNKPLWNGEPLEFIVPEAEDTDEDIHHNLDAACQLTQSRGCPLIWNGLGRWVNFTWTPFCNGTAYHRQRHKQQGYLWIYGDSTATRFHWSIHGKPLCYTIFKRCFYSYNWVYQIDNYNLTLDQFIRRNPNRTFLKQDDNKDFDPDRIIYELKQVLLNPKMDEHSVVLLNYGLHFAEALNFSNFRMLIDKVAAHLKNKAAFKPLVIWRTTTALNRHKYSVPYLHSRRFLTPQVR
ncbi:uncharacterized protein LOC135685803 isoform X2 [Rhopilema esculentum]|uniref:uncharacterized protein LOC135685803 isoform X2 n=1 Tax=Rhopilema esculentum TaxID=499914 RepID=UPI0031DC7CC6